MADEIADPLPLAAEFPAASRDEWLRLVAAVLKGSAFEEKLVARTYDGLSIEPLRAGAKDTRPLAARAPGMPWQVLQRIDHPDPIDANADALHALENGANGLALVLAGAIGAGGYGLAANEAALARALDGVLLDAGIAIELDIDDAAEGPAQLAALIKARGIAPGTACLRFGLDPLGGLADVGAGALAWSAMAPRFAAQIGELDAQGFAGPFAVADGRPVHAAGGSEAQELAFVLAHSVAYLRALEAGGIPLDKARRMIFFRLAADADQFLTVAKFRALRRLWAQIEAACGLSPLPVFVSAETAWRMMTRRDPHVNILRATVATFAAGIGGANAITVLPFTAALGLPDRFARRIARNLQLILIEEANLAKVLDPVAGAGSIEDLTDQLARAAWTLFREIEAAGGAFAALQAGLVQHKVAAVRAARAAAVAHRAEVLTGTSEFADLAEPPALVENTNPAVPGRRPAAAAVRIEPLPRIRLAEPFERLRDASDSRAAATGSRPKVFLATLGTPSDFTARATFAKNFFEAGGIEAVGAQEPVEPPGGEAMPALAAAFTASGAELACLCSSDALYAGDGSGAAQALAAAGARAIYLAGRPGTDAAALRAAGVVAFVHTGCDALATLQTAHDILGMT